MQWFLIGIWSPVGPGNDTSFFSLLKPSLDSLLLRQSRKQDPVFPVLPLLVLQELCSLSPCQMTLSRAGRWLLSIVGSLSSIPGERGSIGQELSVFQAGFEKPPNLNSLPSLQRKWCYVLVLGRPLLRLLPRRSEHLCVPSGASYFWCAHIGMEYFPALGSLKCVTEVLSDPCVGLSLRVWLRGRTTGSKLGGSFRVVSPKSSSSTSICQFTPACEQCPQRLLPQSVAFPSERQPGAILS